MVNSNKVVLDISPLVPIQIVYGRNLVKPKNFRYFLVDSVSPELTILETLILNPVLLSISAYYFIVLWFFITVAHLKI